MAIRSGLFNSVGGDRTYSASNFAEYFASFIGNGVFPNPSNGLQVTSSTNMRVVIKSGKAWINGYYFVNDADHPLTLDVADGLLRRIDRIVLRLNFSNREIVPVIKKGTNASSPVAPVIQRNTDMYEIVLADVLVNNGVTTISQANITDQRMNRDLCGIVAGVVDQINTTNLFAQYEARFNEWFVTVRDTLDGDVAANLASQIQTAQSELEAHKNTNASLTTKGHVQLSNATNSTNELLAATPKAVKAAYDLANEAKQSANSGKIAIATAITNMGVSASPADTFPVLANKVGQIYTGKKWASGTAAASVSAKFVTINNLTFTPSIIFFRYNDPGIGANSDLVCINIWGVAPRKLLGSITTNNSNDGALLVKALSASEYINASGFNIELKHTLWNLGTNPVVVNWVAYE